MLQYCPSWHFPAHRGRYLELKRLSSVDGSETKYFLWSRWPEFESMGWSYIFFRDGIVGSPGSNRVFIVPFGIIFVQSLTPEWLWKYTRLNEIWERVLANSVKGIHKSKIVCSVSLIEHLSRTIKTIVNSCCSKFGKDRMQCEIWGKVSLWVRKWFLI